MRLVKWIKSIKMAFRNIVRNRRRTVFTLSSIVIGLLGVTLLDGFVTYSMWGLRETIVKNGLGHIQIASSPAFFDEGDMDPYVFLLKDPKKIAKKLRAIPEVKQVMPALNFSAVLSADGKNENAMVSAMPSDLAAELLSFRTLESGRQLTASDRRGVIIGKGLASKLGVKVGRSINLITATKGGAVNSLDLEVVGISVSGIAALDNVSVFMELASAQELMLIGEVPVLLVFLEKTEQTGTVLAQLKHTVLPRISRVTGQPLVAKSWEELSDYYQQANTAYRMVLTVARFILLLVTIFVIANTMSMSVFERMREIGSLRAIGCTRGDVLVMFMLEGLMIGVIGSLLGVAVGVGACHLINLLGGIHLPPQPGMSTDVEVLFQPSGLAMLQNMGLTVVVAVLGSVFPALKAARSKIAEILRYI